MESLIYFLIVGLVAGWLASQLVKGGGYGLLGDIVVGIVGAVLGGWLFGLMGIGANNLIGSIIVATVGAVLLILLLRQIKKA